MRIEDLIFIQAVPHNLRFLWEIETQILNFRKFNVSKQMRVLIWYPDLELNKTLGRKPEVLTLPLWQSLSKKYPEVSFYYYKDQGVELETYIPQLRPHILKRHFQQFPELSNSILFYHDSDIIFRELPDFESLMEGDINWQSNTSGYLDINYIRRVEKKAEAKGCEPNELVNILTSIGGISPEIFESYADKTGGAQYVLKNIDASFWEEVEQNSLKIIKTCHYSKEGSFNKRYFDCEANGLQSWCADMWAVNFALWRRGKITNITDELQFSWATNNQEVYNRYKIFHNAGVTPQHHQLFYKGKYLNSVPPPNVPLPPEDSAQYEYVKLLNSRN